jgi:signal transduction histidine kinase
MYSRRTLIAGLATLLVSFAAVATAQEAGSKAEAKAMVDAAVEHVKKVGPEQAFKDFTNDKATWNKKDLYVVAFDMKATMVAHGANPKLVGQNHMEIKDANGVSFTAEMTKLAATKGEGWVSYLWPHPATKKMASKSTYVRKLANFEGWVGVGIYQ